MLESGCREWNNEPNTFAQLKRYWNTLRRDDDFPTPVLVFYQNPNLHHQDFSETFLDKLARFEGLICIVTDQQQSFSLQTFSPQQPDLPQAIVAWIRGNLLEN